MPSSVRPSFSGSSTAPLVSVARRPSPTSSLLVSLVKCDGTNLVAIDLQLVVGAVVSSVEEIFVGNYPEAVRQSVPKGYLMLVCLHVADGISREVLFKYDACHRRVLCWCPHTGLFVCWLLHVRIEAWQPFFLHSKRSDFILRYCNALLMD